MQFGTDFYIILAVVVITIAAKIGLFVFVRRKMMAPPPPPPVVESEAPSSGTP